MTEMTSRDGSPVLLLPKKNVIFDATVFSTLQSCGRLTDLRFNHHLESVRGKSNSLEVGSLVHKVMEVAYRLKSQGHVMMSAIQHGLVAGELYAMGCAHCADISPTEKGQCGHTGGEYPGVRNTPDRSEGNLVGWRDALETCIQYFDHYKNDYWVTLETEVVKGKVIYEDDEIRILWKAKLDWIVDTNQGIYPVDHKTQKARRTKIKLNNQFMGQCTVLNTQGMYINNIGFQRSLKPEEKFTREMMSYSADILEEWRTEIVPYWAYKLLEYTENEYFPPNYTHCENKFGMCQFVGMCGTTRNSREDELKTNFIVGSEWNPKNSDED